ncbi:MAG: SCO family protein [Microscillaceae bacterium]|nr:SCO family protein [Microscillaceae bacterium]
MFFHLTPCSLIFSFLGIVIFNACTLKSEKKLPILGPKELAAKHIKGTNISDTIYHTIHDFEFINQDGKKVNNQTFEDKIYVCNFIFTSCPTICPVMTQQMYRVQEAYTDNSELMFLSHSVDPDRDSAQVLKNYAQKNKAQPDKWHFVTGNKDEIYRMGLKNYMITLDEDEAAPGGFLHSAAFILVDKERRVRGVYNGTDETEVNQLIEDIKILLQEYENL